jgi:hypothetical protein
MMIRPLSVLFVLALIVTLGCVSPSQPESQEDKHQKLVEKALQNTNVRILRKQLERIPKGTPGRERVVAHMEDLIAKDREAAATREPVPVICALQKYYIDSDPRELYAALEKALGSDAMGDRTYHDPYWIGDVKFPGGKMQIYEEKSVLDQINIWFDPPVHRDTALEMFGFPTNVPPTKEGPLFFIWKQVFGVDRLHFSRVRGTNEIKRAMVEYRYQEGSPF